MQQILPTSVVSIVFWGGVYFCFNDSFFLFFSFLLQVMFCLVDQLTQEFELIDGDHMTIPRLSFQNLDLNACGISYVQDYQVRDTVLLED